MASPTAGPLLPQGPRDQDPLLPQGAREVLGRSPSLRRARPTCLLAPGLVGALFLAGVLLRAHGPESLVQRPMMVKGKTSESEVQLAASKEDGDLIASDDEDKRTHKNHLAASKDDPEKKTTTKRAAKQAEDTKAPTTAPHTAKAHTLADNEEKPARPQGAPKCSPAGGDCLHTGCCEEEGETCVAGGFEQGVPTGHAHCQSTHTGSEVPFLQVRELPETSVTTWLNNDGVLCNSQFVAPPMPVHGAQHNGVALPATCFNGTGEHHVFVISDWGGILPNHNGNIKGLNKHSFNHITPGDHTPFGAHIRDYVNGTDEYCQFRVAEQFNKHAATIKPDYILQGGDAFYWGGVETHCGVPIHVHAATGQWHKIYEEMYKGPGVDGKQWLGVLGNHDYGGWMYIAAWDQIIGYTWGGEGSTGRWMMPAQYWSAKVYYIDFSVDYYFMDTNFFDTTSETKLSLHNICNMDKVGQSATPSCGTEGPKTAHDCPGWFKKLWLDQKQWLKKNLANSTANWQIIVTHFPPTWGKAEWPEIAREHGVDLMITGHKHQQEIHTDEDTLAIIDGWSGLYSDFMGTTAWIVSGGGGGVTSQGTPDKDGHDDQYGFMDLSLSRYEIKVKAISHGGQVRMVKTVHQRHPAIPRKNYTAYLTPQQEALEKPNPRNCGTNKYTFYVYRAQQAGKQKYKDQNINAANLAGVLWYLHHEVVMECPRKFGIEKIRRMKVTMQNTCDLYNDTKTQFGPYSAFDTGKCGVKGCDLVYQKYGSVVGCQHIPFNTGLFAAYCEQPNCGYAHWYSFPGPCTKQDAFTKTDECIAQDPGGLCNEVNGERDCTYKFENAGEVYLDELYKTVNQWYPWSEFCKSELEYNNKTDYGIGVTWWNEIYSSGKCRERYNNITALFKKKYPKMPESYPEPRCDYYETDPKDYFHRTGSGFDRTFTQRQIR